MPRALAGIGSGVGAVVLIGGALWSAVRFGRQRTPGSGRLALGNVLIALGTLVLSSGGLIQGTVGHDEAFAISLATGISVIYAGFVGRVRCDGRRSLSLDDNSLTQQLAGERTRQLGDDLDARRQLVAREATAGVPQQFDGIGIRARARHDERDDGLAGARVRFADHRDLRDRGMRSRSRPRPRRGRR